MAIKKITRKVITPVIKPGSLKKEGSAGKSKENGEVRPVREQPENEQADVKGRSRKNCSFCQTHTNPLYTDLNALRRFLTDRAKIVAKEKSGVCSKHQRQVAKNIKYARHLALLPFVPKV